MRVVERGFNHHRVWAFAEDEVPDVTPAGVPMDGAEDEDLGPSWRRREGEVWGDDGRRLVCCCAGAMGPAGPENVAAGEGGRNVGKARRQGSWREGTLPSGVRWRLQGRRPLVQTGLHWTELIK